MVIKIKITEDQKKYWETNFSKIRFPSVVQDKINRRGKANLENYLYGFLAQIVIADWLESARPVFSFGSGFDGGFDIIHSGKKIDIVLRFGTVPPRPHFEYLIPERKFNYVTDDYWFCYINKKNFNILYLVGHLTKEELHKKAKFRKRGERKLLDNGNSWVFEDNNLEILGGDLNALNISLPIKQLNLF